MIKNIIHRCVHGMAEHTRTRSGSSARVKNGDTLGLAEEAAVPTVGDVSIVPTKGDVR